MPELACFRIDFPASLGSLPPRDRSMALALADGHAANEVARRFGLTASRVTQLRQRWREGWHAFQGETPPARR